MKNKECPLLAAELVRRMSRDTEILRWREKVIRATKSADCAEI